jgi:DNA-binding MarR family transcriptional regulator
VQDHADAVTTDAAADAAANDDAARLQLAVTRLSRRLRRETGADLTPSQLSVMSSIHRLGPVTLGDLADCERVAPPTITRIVGKLEEAGLVVREVDPADRRIARLRTTPSGRRLVASVRDRKARWLGERLDRLPARERARLLAAVDALERLAEEP